MGYFLKDRKCECGGYLRIKSYRDERMHMLFIDNAECVICERQDILSDEPYREFVNEFGVKIEENAAFREELEQIARLRLAELNARSFAGK